MSPNGDIIALAIAPIPIITVVVTVVEAFPHTRLPLCEMFAIFVFRSQEKNHEGGVNTVQDPQDLERTKTKMSQCLKKLSRLRLLCQPSKA